MLSTENSYSQSSSSSDLKVPNILIVTERAAEEQSAGASNIMVPIKVCFRVWLRRDLMTTLERQRVRHWNVPSKSSTEVQLFMTTILWPGQNTKWQKMKRNPPSFLSSDHWRKWSKTQPFIVETRLHNLRVNVCGKYFISFARKARELRTKNIFRGYSKPISINYVNST